MMFAEFFQDTLLPAILSVGAAVVTLLAGMAIDALRKWGEKQKNQTVSIVLGEAASAAERAVAMVQQTFLDEVRVAREDGHLSKDEATKAFRLAIAAAKAQLGVSGLSALAKVVGGDAQANEVLSTMVEAAVSKKKPATQSASDFIGG